jgi:hypothetical protein
LSSQAEHRASDPTLEANNPQTERRDQSAYPSSFTSFRMTPSIQLFPILTSVDVNLAFWKRTLLDPIPISRNDRFRAGFIVE